MKFINYEAGNYEEFDRANDCQMDTFQIIRTDYDVWLLYEIGWIIPECMMRDDIGSLNMYEKRHVSHLRRHGSQGCTYGHWSCSLGREITNG